MRLFILFQEMTSVIEENEEMEAEGSYTLCNHVSSPLAVMVPPPQSFYDGSVVSKRCHINDNFQKLCVDSGTSSRDQSKIICSFKHNHIIPQKVYIYHSFLLLFAL